MSEKISASNPNHEDPAADQEQDERDSALSLKGGMGLNIGFLAGVQRFLGEVRVEFRKISWPNRQTVLTETVVVLIVVVFLTILITSMDWVFTQISNRFLV